MTDDERLRRAAQARHELKITDEAFEKVREAIMKELVNTSPGQPEKILALHRAAQNLSAVKSAVLSVVNDGLVAEQAIALAGLTRTS